MSAPCCICIPARDEAAGIAVLIEALGRQSVAAPLLVALCVNNSSDDTAAIARAAAGRTEHLRLVVEEVRFEAGLAHAGSARRAAMDLGARLLADGAAILISTDADCRPPDHWVAENLAACVDGRIVGGRIELDDGEPIDPAIIAMRRRFDAYWRQVRAIEDAIDPVAWDRPPRHGDHTGASLALSVDLYRRAGGVPLLASGEDRALVDAAIAAGGTLVHPPRVWTRASARRSGRAEGGMAGDMARWIDCHREDRSPRVPSLDQWRLRALWRRERRSRIGDRALAAAERGLTPMVGDIPLPELAS